MTGAPNFSGQTAIPIEQYDSLTAALQPVLSAATEHVAWKHTVNSLTRLMGADSGLGMEVYSNSRAQARASHSMPMRLDEPFPFAPDSQAAYVVDSEQVVVSACMESETRFVPGSILLRSGIRSSMSQRFELGTDTWGTLGVFWTEPRPATQAELATFALFVRLAGWTIRQLREHDSLEHQAKRDTLTRVWTRAIALEKLSELVDSGQAPTVLMVDLDRFKNINDEIGHWAGDAVLSTVASRINRTVPVGQIVGRLGGDEFIVVLNGDEHHENLRIASAIIGAVEESISLDHRVVSVSASVGMAETIPGDDSASLIRRADQAMYAAKKAGRGQIQVAEKPVHASTLPPTPKIVSLHSEDYCDLSLVEDAIAGLRVLTVPVVSASTGELDAYQTVVRGPRGSRLEDSATLYAEAATFGRLAELELAAKQQAFALPVPPGKSLVISVDPLLITDTDWFDQLHSIWKASGETQQIVAAITEDAAVRSPGRILAAAERIRSLGWKLSIEGVGGRKQALTALRLFRPEVVSVDVTLLHKRNVGHRFHVSATIAAYRQSQPIKVVAQRVDTEAHVTVAGQIDADLIQGRLLGRPAPPTDLPSVLELPSESWPQCFGSDKAARVATETELSSIRRYVESEAFTSDSIIVTSLPAQEPLADEMVSQYVALARRCGFVGLVGDSVATYPGQTGDIRLAEIASDDSQIGQWKIAVISPTKSIALVAQMLPPQSSSHQSLGPQYRYQLLTDPEEVVGIAQDLLRHF